MNEQRNDYGFPVIDKHEAARQYAEAVRERNRLPGTCPTCREKEMLPAVIQITSNWRNQ